MARYLAAISKADTQAMREFERLRREHERALAELEAKRREIAEKQEALRKETVRYEAARKEKAELLARLEKDLETHREETARLRAAEEELLSILNLSPPPDAPVLVAPVPAPPRPPERQPARVARAEPPAPPRPFRLRRGDLQAPVRGELLVRFGERRPGGSRVQGVLIRAAGDRLVRAVAPGEVRFAGPFPGLGNTVIVAHGDRYHTVYAHLAELLREVGDRVSEGEAVGRLPAEDPVLHFELRAEGKPLDPGAWLRGGYAAFR